MFLADENFDFNIIKALCSTGFGVLLIAEQSPSIADPEVLVIAVERKAVLLTEDKDFGELVYRPQLPNCGVLLARLLKINAARKCQLVIETLQNHSDNLQNSFSVLGDDNLRIKSSLVQEIIYKNRCKISLFGPVIRKNFN